MERDTRGAREAERLWKDTDMRTYTRVDDRHKQANTNIQTDKFNSRFTDGLATTLTRTHTRARTHIHASTCTHAHAHMPI